MSTRERDVPVDGRDDGEEEARDTAFRRSLIESAREDHVSDGATRAAWSRFAAAMGTMGPPAAGGAELPRGTTPAAAGKHAEVASAMKWILVGAIGGSALTAALVRAPTGTPRVVVVPASVTHVESPPAPIVITSATAPVAPPLPIAPPPSEPANTDQRPRRLPSTVRPRETTDAVVAPALGATEQVTTTPSDLAAEVSVLDAARVASARGAFDDAIRLVEQYHRRFPRGALAADADVIAIDALQGKNDRSGVATQAARFLSHYPNDPHAAHVRRLAGGR